MARIRGFLLGLAVALAATVVSVRDSQASTVPPSDGGAVGQLPLRYEFFVSSGDLIPGTVDAGNHCDDCTTELDLPFPFSLYGQTFTKVRVNSNGTLEFGSDNSDFFNQCLPYPAMEYSIMPHWDDLDAGLLTGDGVYTATVGTAPHRVFAIEWRTHYFADFDNAANFEVVLHEDAPMFEIIYGQIAFNGSSATVGVQGAGDQHTQYLCEQALITPGLHLLVGFSPSFAGDDAATVSVNSGETAIDVLANDSDYTGTLRFSAITAATHGSVAVSADGYSILYKPAIDYVGADSFTYSITNILGGAATGTVSIDVINHNPVARDDSAVVDEDSSITVSVLANDDFAPDTGETLSVISAAGASHGRLAYTTASVTYTPEANYYGADSFTYTISDNHGGTATARVTVQVRSVNDNPTAADDTAMVDQGSSVSIQVLANDSSAPDTGETLAITAAGPAAHGSVQVTANAITYTPAAGFSGQDAFSYAISDGNGGSATARVVVSVRKVNSAPELALAGSAGSIKENEVFTLQGTVTDPDAADTHTVVIAWGDGSPNTVLQLAAGVNSFSASHRYLDNPPAGTSFAPVSATVADAAGESATASVSVSVQNLAPVITSLTASASALQLGAAVTLTVAFSDAGTLDTHQVRINWGDGSAETVLNDGGYSRAAAHTYAAQGFYSPVITVTDKDGSAVSATAGEIVVYDGLGSGASIKGNGWTQLPAGVSAGSPTLSGKASFSADVAYANSGAAAGSLWFGLGTNTLSSTAIDWLIVSDNSALFQGRATVNGSGAYRFRFTGLDGKVGSVPDQVRLQVWSLATGALVFDSAGIENANDSSMLQRLGGGNLTVRPRSTTDTAASSVAPTAKTPRKKKR